MRALIAAAALAVTTCLPSITAEDTIEGLSRERIARIDALMREEVSDGQVPSAAALVSRNGRVVFERYAGTMGSGQEIEPGTIMRTASITKAVTAALIMVLYEEGALVLDDPVARYLPAFETVTLAASEGEAGEQEPREARQSPTIRHLLTHRAGLQRYSEGVNELWSSAATVREFADSLAALPLRHEPGEGFAYGNAYEVLAAVAEVAGEQRFDRLMKSRILEPLGMHDTHFFVPESKRERLSALYTRDDAGELVPLRKRGQEEEAQTFFSGGGGLRTTVRDFHRFASMLLREGELDGVRVLSPKTVRLMTRDQVPESVEGAWEGDWGWGFGMAVRRRVESGEVGTAGSFGWNGGTGTWFFVDPKERLAAVIFTQLNPGNPHDLRERFERAVYFAIVESYALREAG